MQSITCFGVAFFVFSTRTLLKDFNFSPPAGEPALSKPALVYNRGKSEFKKLNVFRCF